MKKLLAFWILLMLFRLPTYGQTIYWLEDFNSSQGWYLQDNWSITSGMLQFSWTPSINNFDLSATSPYIELDENVGELIITQYLNIFSNSPDEFAEIYIITESSEILLWEYPLSGGNWGNPSGTEIIFPVSDYAGQTVKFKFRTYGGTTFNWNNWNIFNLSLTAYFDYDLAVSNFTGPTVVNVLDPNTWTVEVSNNGTTAISAYDVEILCHKTLDTIATIQGTEPINPQESMNFDIEWTSNAAFNTAFYGIVSSENDQFEGNNSSGSHFIRIDPGIPCNILLWDNDNGIQTVYDPEKGDLIKPAKGLERVLLDAGYDFEYTTYLPDDLDSYDIVLSTMGCFCVD